MENSSGATHLLCDSCGAQISLRRQVNLCPQCGGLLEVQYDLKKLNKSAHLFAHYVPDSIWRYRNFYPPVEDRHIVTLGEGGTPLIKSHTLGKKYGIEHLYFKNDTMMPTGSFKDRGFSLAISYAMEIGVKRGMTYSSGNAGASFAAYSARANFPGVVVVEYQASETKKAMIMLYGAETAVLEFNNFEEIATMLDAAATKLGIYMFVNFMNPIRHEAMKTYAYETYTQLKKVPDFSFHPLGTGGGVWGAWKGYNELVGIGVADKLPHMVAVQPEAVAWLKKAVDSGAEIASMYGDSTKTIAQSISGNSPLHGGRRLIKAVTNSRGAALAVTDKEIMEAMLDLGQEGIAAEPSSAAGVAAFKQMAETGKIGKDDTVVCTITGTALKQPEIVKRVTPEPRHTIGASVEELKELMMKLNLLP